MKILFAGDIAINVKKEIIIAPEVVEYIKGHDYSICNFEAPIISNNAERIIKVGPYLSNNEDSINIVRDAGFNVVALANNHIMDYGLLSLLNTINIFTSNEVITLGASDSYDDCYSPVKLKRDNEEVYLFNACQAEFGVYKEKNAYYMGGYAWINNPDFRRTVRTHCERQEKVMIFAHAGLEEEELPLPEWRNVYREYIDWGVEMVVASHPHIIQGVEIYKGKRIYYSLGNLLFPSETYKDNPEWNQSMVVSIDTITGEHNVRYLCYEDDELKFADEMKVGNLVEMRSDILKDEELYIKRINEIVDRCWDSYYRSYYENACGNIRLNEKNIKWWIINMIKGLFCKSLANEIDMAHLLHNIQIESHRWAVERYLSNRINIVDENG